MQLKPSHNSIIDVINQKPYFHLIFAVIDHIYTTTITKIENRKCRNQKHIVSICLLQSWVMATCRRSSPIVAICQVDDKLVVTCFDGDDNASSSSPMELHASLATIMMPLIQ